MAGLVTTAVVLAVVVGVIIGAVTLLSRLNFGGLPGGGPQPVLAIQPAEGPVGTQISATATGFDPGATVEFVFHARPLAQSVADANGAASATFKVPKEMPDGPWTITAHQQQSVKSDDALFTVT